MKTRQRLFDPFIAWPIAAVAGAATLFFDADPGAAFGAGAVVAVGFGLPKWVGLGERANRARRAKAEEADKWGFHGRDRDAPWIAYVDRPVLRTAACAEGKRFYSEWLVIHDGHIVVNPGESTRIGDRVTYDHGRPKTYAWDGCTPKGLFYWLALVGAPDLWHGVERIVELGADGRPECREMFWQKAHHASLIHDALYQYLDRIPIAKSDVDRLLYAMLRESGVPAPLAWLYHAAARLFGARDVKRSAPPPNSTWTAASAFLDRLGPPRRDESP